MKLSVRVAILFALAFILILAGWRIVHLMQSDAALDQGEVDRALDVVDANPEALLRRAESRLAERQIEAAAVAARRLLQVSPTEGRGYRVLAQIAELRGRHDAARKLFSIAARRAPRDLAARAWLAQDALERGVPTDALQQIDHLLTLSPSSGATIFPVLVKLSADPGFADALADVLSSAPSWRGEMVAWLQRAPAEDRSAAGQVLGALQRNGGFDAGESKAWIQSLLGEGHWAEAYARWASPIVASGKPMPLLFNGNFSTDPSEGGFDWLLPVTPGVIIEFEPGSGGGQILHARFLGRRMVGNFLEHRLLLAPGHYALQVRQRAAGLRSDNGLGWTLTCEGAPAPQASSEALKGSRGWTSITVAFTVPAGECKGQWLRMGNAGAIGAGQLVSGDLWLEAARIERIRDRKTEHD
ncbi:MAG: tetratricopeptide repeat protein [Pseudomonas sp.]